MGHFGTLFSYIWPVLVLLALFVAGIKLASAIVNRCKKAG